MRELKSAKKRGKDKGNDSSGSSRPTNCFRIPCFLLVLGATFFQFLEVNISIKKTSPINGNYFIRFLEESDEGDDKTTMTTVTTSTTTAAGKVTTTNNNNDETASFPEISIRDTTKVIFYHLFIPDGPPTNVIRIVDEQIRQVGGKKDVTLLYNIIGNSTILKPENIDRLCYRYNLTACHLLGRYESAMETATLTNVHQYCQQHPNQRVGYMHDKGSHHPHQGNEIWRYMMTEALVSDECWNTTTTTTTNPSSSNDDQSCNACGLYFTHDRGLYFAGNVWTADCSYVKDLIPPKDFASHQKEVYKDALYRKTLGQFDFTLFPIPPIWNAGIGRYSDEWWIGTHPDIRPCDFSKSLTLYPGEMPTDRFLFTLEKHKADHRDVQKTIMTKFAPQAPTLIHHDATVPNIKKQYHLLGGWIHRWLHLYGKLPDQNSWAWKSYPWADWWKLAVQQHGTDVLDKMLPVSEEVGKDLIRATGSSR